MRSVEEGCDDSEPLKLLWERLLVGKFALHCLREGRGVIASMANMSRKWN